MSVDEQLPIRFPYNEQQTFGNYKSLDNSELIAKLDAVLVESDFVGLWVWGKEGAGVTHILNACCHFLDLHAERAAYLPLATLPANKELLSGLESMELVALDNVEEWLGNQTLEEALMAIYEEVMIRKGTVVFGSISPPKSLKFVLPDLRSRCVSCLSSEVHSLNDLGRIDLLRSKAKDRGLLIDDRVARYWTTRSSRSLVGLMQDLELLDEAAMRHQRKLTIPFVKTVLKL